MRLTAPIFRMSLTVSFCGAWLCACAYAPVDQSPTPDTEKEQPAVTTQATSDAGQGAAPVKPQITAEQALTRLLELIRSSKSIQDFTPEHVSQAMGVKIEHAHDGSGNYGFGEDVTSEWNHGFGVNMKVMPGPRFDFSFNPIVPGTYPDMTDVCQVDFDQFSSELKAMGFSSEPYYAEHGRLASHLFTRPGMKIEVYPDGEWVWSEEKGNGRTCVKMVLIH